MTLDWHLYHSPAPHHANNPFFQLSSLVANTLSQPELGGKCGQCSLQSNIFLQFIYSYSWGYAVRQGIDFFHQFMSFLDMKAVTYLLLAPWIGSGGPGTWQSYVISSHFTLTLTCDDVTNLEGVGGGVTMTCCVRRERKMLSLEGGQVGGTVMWMMSSAMDASGWGGLKELDSMNGPDREISRYNLLVEGVS